MKLVTLVPFVQQTTYTLRCFTGLHKRHFFIFFMGNETFSCSWRIL